jgi:hypothetical protein
MVVTIPAALINAANIFLHIGKGPASISIIATIVTVFLTQLGYIFHILTTVASVMIYFNLTESKEGTGLLERMNQFGSKGPDTSTTPEEY